MLDYAIFGVKKNVFVNSPSRCDPICFVSAALNMQESQGEASERPPCPVKQGKCSKRKSQARESKGSFG